MVSTRNNVLTPVPTLESLNDDILEIKKSMNAFLIAQNKVSDEINKLKSGEGTSAPDVLQEKLKQDGIVKDYQEKFKELLNMVELEEKHAISLFLGGLKSEISLQIRMFTLYTLTEAFYMAKMQEHALVALKSRYTPLLPTPVSKSNNNVAFGGRTNNVPIKPNTSYNNPNRKRLTQKEYEEKRANNLCFYCDKKYVLGHKCAGQLYSLIVIRDTEGEEGIGEETMEVDNVCEEIVETDIGM
ncbi:hypothetical protein Tco_1173454 [Tanacetum coccineum]